MKSSLTRPRALLLALALSVVPWLSLAGTIDIEKGEGDFVVAVLDAENRLHVDAMQAMLTKAYPAFVENGQRRIFKSIAGRLHGATLARFEYRYTKDGSEHVRTYHARSGRSMKVIVDRAQARANSSASSATESGDTDASGGSGYVADDIEQDLIESEYYPQDTFEHVRVAALPDTRDPIEAVDIGDRKSHATDAELKIVRRIDADVEDGVVQRGGKLTGYVSKTACESCRNAFQTLATRHDIDGAVYQLIEPEETGPAGGRRRVTPPDEATPLGRSQKASIDLKARRTTYANAEIRQGNRRQPGAPWNDVGAVERAETSAATAELAEACD